MGPVWIIADAHGGADPDSDRALIEVLDHARLRGVDLVLLGDLFAGWIAPERFWTPYQRSVIERCLAMRGRHQRIRFVVGNRDYLVREALLGRAFDAVYEEETVVDIAGVPTMVAHGDRANSNDLAYHLWYRVSRSAPAKLLLERIPAGAGQGLVRLTERALSGTNRRYKTSNLPIRALEALGRRARAKGASRALVGHFHHDRVLDVWNGAPVVLAPSWLEHRRILESTPDGRLRSVSFDDLVR